MLNPHTCTLALTEDTVCGRQAVAVWSDYGQTFGLCSEHHTEHAPFVVAYGTPRIGWEGGSMGHTDELEFFSAEDARSFARWVCEQGSTFVRAYVQDPGTGRLMGELVVSYAVAA